MTDLLTRDPNDTGEIPLADRPGRAGLADEPTRDLSAHLGETTRNLAPYAVSGLPPALRRPTVEVPAITGGCRMIDPDDPDFQPSAPGTPPGPDPLPPPPPPTPDHAAAQPIAPLERVIDGNPDLLRVAPEPKGWLARWRYKGRRRAGAR